MNTMTADRDFTKNFLISCGVHALLVLTAYFGGTTFMKMFNVNDKVEIIRSSVRVDVVGMPKFTVKELKAMQAEPVAKPIPEPEGAKVEAKAETEDVIKKDDIVIQEKGTPPSTKKKTSFLNMINDYSSKKVAPSERKKGAKASTNKALDSLIIEGNKLSKGGALVGEYSESDNSELGQYVQALPELVRVHFKLPSYLKEMNLRCKVVVFISPSGNVIKTEIRESSGNEEYDNRAEKAIRDASPLPKPPESVAARLTPGILLSFPL